MLLHLYTIVALFTLNAAQQPNDTLSALLHNTTEMKTTTETPEQREVNEFWVFVNVVKRRLLLGYKVAIFKHHNNKPIEDVKREEIILNNIVEKAKTYNLSETWSRRFFQDQMDANKYVQSEFIKKWNSTGIAPTEDVNLDTVRKLIDTINSELFTACVATERLRSSANCTDHLQTQKGIIVTLLNSDPVYTKAMDIALRNACFNDENQ